MWFGSYIKNDYFSYMGKTFPLVPFDAKFQASKICTLWFRFLNQIYGWKISFEFLKQNQTDFNYAIISVMPPLWVAAKLM